MKSITKYILMGVVGIGVIGAAIGLYLFNKPTQDLSNRRPEYIIDAQSLMTEFRLDERQANEKYLGNILQVSGTVMAIEKGMDGSMSYSLEDVLFGITCTINAENSKELTAKGIHIDEGDEVSLKGRCDGLLTDVRISECVLIDE